MNGALAFVDTSDCTLMNIAEHYMASDVEWDPTGRYVVTSVSSWSHKVRIGLISGNRENELLHSIRVECWYGKKMPCRTICTRATSVFVIHEEIHKATVLQDLLSPIYF